MLIDALRGFADDPALTIISLITMIIVLLISLTVHEYSHARMALAMGDQTALLMGRLTLNPIKHIDPVGGLMLLLFGFGYAKPVPINTRNFTKVGYKAGLALVSLAGPLSNLVLAFIGILGWRILNTVYYHVDFSYNIYLVAVYFFYYFTYMNIGLMVFNLIPIPPLDGSRLLTIFLPGRIQVMFFKYEHIIQLVIFFLLWRGVFDGPLFAIRNAVFSGLDRLVSLIPFLQ